MNSFFTQHATGNSAADAFAAWWLHRRYHLAPADAFARAPGGSHDFGVDGFYIETPRDSPAIVHIIQAKYSDSRKLIKEAYEGFAKAAPQIGAILSGNMIESATLNPLYTRLAGDLQSRRLTSKEGGDVELRFEVLHLCQEASEILYESLQGPEERFRNAVASHLPNHSCSLRLIYPPEELDRDIIVPAAEKLDIGFEGTRVASEGTFTFYAGFGYLADLVELYTRRGDALFSKNIRMYLFNA